MRGLEIGISIGLNSGGGGADAPLPPMVPNEITTATPRSWHRADSLITPGAGISVAGWGDKFGNGYNVAQATGTKQPTTTTLAGQPALNFASAASRVLNLTNATLCNNLAGGTDVAYTVYIVLSAFTLPGSPIPFGLGSSANANIFHDTYIVAGDSGVNHERRDGVGAATNATMIGGAFALQTPYLMRIRFSGTSVEIVLNGVTLSASTALDVGAMSFDRFSIGAATRTAVAGLAGTFWNGAIAEVITYTGLVSESEEDRLVADYFLPRYGAGVGSPRIAIQPAGARIGAFSAPNHWEAAPGNTLDFANNTAIAFAFWRVEGTNGNQYLLGCNSALTGFFLQAGNAHDLRLFHGVNSTYFADIYFGLNVGAISKDGAGALRWSLNGGVARALTSPGAYIQPDVSAILSIGYNAAAASSPADQHSLLWNAFIGAALSDADLQAISGQANALDRWHAPALVTGHAALRWLANWESWDGAAATFAGVGSAPVTMNRVGTGGGRSVMRGYKRYQVPASAVWDSVEAFSQGVTGTIGLRRSAYAQTRFTTSAEDVAGGPAGLVVDCLASTWNVGAWPGQIQAGVNVSGVNLVANHNGLVPVPGFIQTEGYGLQRAVDCPGIVSGADKPVILTDGMQTTTGAGVGSASTVLYVRVPDTDSVIWTPRVAPAACAINVFDSLGGQIEGLNQDTGIINPTNNAWPALQRANAGAMRVACEGRGSGTWFQRISSPTLRAAFIESLRKQAVGTLLNLFWIDLGSNDFGLSTYPSLATLTSDLTSFNNGMVALGLPGFKLIIVGPTERLNETSVNANGWNLPQLRTALELGVTNTAHVDVTYVNAFAFVSAINRPDGLHRNPPGHVEYEAGMRPFVGY